MLQAHRAGGDKESDIHKASDASNAAAQWEDATFLRAPRLGGVENNVMMITILAAAMTILMLIATAVGVHQEAERVRLKDRSDRSRGFGRY
ncbi:MULTISPECIES: hypothetical protein [Mesorhizobium]|uniref:Uncharacterized protein n=1 Tax=Mesorhizobium denitrificans TaxID=2294114 RepID=A0A371XDL2_9HYPH|nr:MULTISPECIES: hypothetical protein [Mesorhizobium]RFC67318.1 hypothetical protein DY251_12270 [Mesorhizobium denitrificans]